MKKIAFLLICLASSSAWSHPIEKFFTSDPDKAILTESVTTPDNKEIILDSVRILAGKDCDSLVVKWDKQSNPEEGFTMSADPGEHYISSEDMVFLEAILWDGMPGSTGCLKLEKQYQGRWINTTKIQLEWNGSEYVRAIPSYIVEDYTQPE